MSVDRLYDRRAATPPVNGRDQGRTGPTRGDGVSDCAQQYPRPSVAIPHATDVGPNSGSVGPNSGSATADPGPTPNERNTRLPATGVGTVTPPPQQYAPPAGVRAQVRCAASSDVNDTFLATDAGRVCGRESCAPMPSWPVSLCPQQNAAPALVSPQVKSAPATMDASGGASCTGIGCSRDTVELSPSCPQVLSPQQYAVPSAVSAHVCAPPAVMAANRGAPVTGSGVSLQG